MVFTTAPLTGAPTSTAEKRMTPAVRILIVDDSPMFLKGLAAFLRQLGCVVSIGGGSEALAALRGQTFDVIFVDYLMTAMDGLDVARAIRG